MRRQKKREPKGSLESVRCACNQSKGSSLVGILPKNEGTIYSVLTELIPLYKLNIGHPHPECKKYFAIEAFFSPIVLYILGLYTLFSSN